MVTNSRNKAKLLKSASFCRTLIVNKGGEIPLTQYKIKEAKPTMKLIRKHILYDLSWKLPRSHVTQNGFVITSINKSIIFAVNCHTKQSYGLNVITCILLYNSNSMLFVAVCLNLVVYLPICETLTPKKSSYQSPMLSTLY